MKNTRLDSVVLSYKTAKTTFNKMNSIVRIDYLGHSKSLVLQFISVFKLVCVYLSLGLRRLPPCLCLTEFGNKPD